MRKIERGEKEREREREDSVLEIERKIKEARTILSTSSVVIRINNNFD